MTGANIIPDIHIGMYFFCWLCNMQVAAAAAKIVDIMFSAPNLIEGNSSRFFVALPISRDAHTKAKNFKNKNNELKQ